MHMYNVDVCGYIFTQPSYMRNSKTNAISCYTTIYVEIELNCECSNVHSILCQPLVSPLHLWASAYKYKKFLNVPFILLGLLPCFYLYIPAQKQLHMAILSCWNTKRKWMLLIFWPSYLYATLLDTNLSCLEGVLAFQDI